MILPNPLNKAFHRLSVGSDKNKISSASWGSLKSYLINEKKKKPFGLYPRGAKGKLNVLTKKWNLMLRDTFGAKSMVNDFKLFGRDKNCLHCINMCQTTDTNNIITTFNLQATFANLWKDLADITGVWKWSCNNHKPSERFQWSWKAVTAESLITFSYLQKALDALWPPS